MGTAKTVLKGFSCLAAFWSLLFSLLQIALMGWQIGEVNEQRRYWQNRPLPRFSGIDPQRAKYPGLYHRYYEGVERNRYTVLFILTIMLLILGVANLVSTGFLLYGIRRENRSYMWPWYFTIIPTILITVTYAIVWWTGDVFNEQFTLSVFEFLTAVPCNAFCFFVVLFFYIRLSGVALFGPIHSPPFRGNNDEEKSKKSRNNDVQRPYSQQRRPPTYGEVFGRQEYSGQRVVCL